jgi:transcription initiation factor TFIIH subunit 1
MTICQTATNEFLRQFWSSMYPPAAEVQVVAVATPAQRTAKAAKMIGYLSKTQEKVDALVYMGPQHNVDPARIEIVSFFSCFYFREEQMLRVNQAMKPVLDAANRAIAFHRTKTSKPAPRG